MQKIKGRLASATVFSDTAENYAIAQIQLICDNEAAAGSKISIMPDVHPGRIGPIGLTMTVGSKVIPSLVGSDIGCGITYIQIKNTKIEYQRLDKVIREYIPSGAGVRRDPHLYSRDFDFSNLLCRKHINEKKAELSLGTLGGGNHFIELCKDKDENIYAAVHTGSRHLGKEVTDFYVKKGHELLKKKGMVVPYEITYLEGELMEEYLHDVFEVQGYAMLNREIILRELAKHMKWKVEKHGESIHNYVDENRILRKGAVSAYKEDEVIIPVNMRDGIILAEGKGNPLWNYSAPHGGGRIMSREDVRKTHTVSEFKRQVQGIYSTTVNAETLDEAPFAYRGIEEIKDAIKDTVEVRKILKPIYNYKAGERR